MNSDYESDHISPESAYTLKDGRAEVKIQFSAEAMERAASDIVQKHIEANFIPRLESAVGSYLDLTGYSKFEELIKEVVRAEFVKRYPDVVENKVNEIHNYLLKMKPEDTRDWRWMPTSKTISEAARHKVNEYIENELKNEVKVTKEWLETFSRNYFANNLFRAMGMMDKMIPEAIGEKK
jgi:hypothetical protein